MKILTREDLREKLKKGEISPVYLLFGAETFLRDLAVKTITDRTLADSQLREFNENTFSLNDIDAQSALASAEQLPMMASRRVVKITELNKLKESDGEALLHYLKRPAETCVVMFVAEELDKRKRISKILLDNCVPVEFTTLKDHEIQTWTRQKAKELNVRIDEKALRYLLNLVGNGVRKLTSELEKLAVAALPETIITQDLVEKLTPNSREVSNFDLSDRLMAGDRNGAMKVLQKVLNDGAEPLMLLGLIANNYHRLFLAKELMSQGVERIEVARIMKLPPFKQEDFLATARRADGNKLSQSLQRIAETDLAIKTSKGTPRLQIEMLVSELTGQK
jgi:DNA polymerase III subunit delta